MNKSDFFVVITIVLAIIALFSETNRKYILYKFSYFKIFLLLVGFLIVHFLVWSNKWLWWKEKWFDVYYLENNCFLFKKIISYFNISVGNFPTPSTYAYILFIVILFLVCLNIKNGSFSNRYLNALIDDYKIMLDENEMEKLYNLLKKYHFNDIFDYLRKKNSLMRIVRCPWMDSM